MVASSSWSSVLSNSGKYYFQVVCSVRSSSCQAPSHSWVLLPSNAHHHHPCNLDFSEENYHRHYNLYFWQTIKQHSSSPFMQPWLSRKLSPSLKPRLKKRKIHSKPIYRVGVIGWSATKRKEKASTVHCSVSSYDSEGDWSGHGTRNTRTIHCCVASCMILWDFSALWRGGGVWVIGWLDAREGTVVCSATEGGEHLPH